MNGSTIEFSPDYLAIRRSIREQIWAFKTANGDQDPPKKEIRRYIKAAARELGKVLKECQLTELPEGNSKLTALANAEFLAGHPDSGKQDEEDLEPDGDDVPE